MGEVFRASEPHVCEAADGFWTWVGFTFTVRYDPPEGSIWRCDDCGRYWRKWGCVSWERVRWWHLWTWRQIRLIAGHDDALVVDAEIVCGATLPGRCITIGRHSYVHECDNPADHDGRHECDNPADHDGRHECDCGHTWTEPDDG